jgi:hypothetical protein
MLQMVGWRKLKLWNGGGFPFSGVHGFQSVLYCGVRSQDTLSLNEVAKVDALGNGGCKSEAKSRGCWCDGICVFLLQDLKSNVQLVKFCTHAVFQSIVNDLKKFLACL